MTTLDARGPVSGLEAFFPQSEKRRDLPPEFVAIRARIDAPMAEGDYGATQTSPVSAGAGVALVRRVLMKLFLDHRVLEAVRELLLNDPDTVRILSEASARDDDNWPRWLGHGVFFDYATGDLTGPESTVRLTPLENDLLAYLLSRAGALVSSGELQVQVWRYAADSESTDVVRSHMKNLRRKLLEVSPATFIRNVHGRGYQLVLPLPPNAGPDNP